MGKQQSLPGVGPKQIPEIEDQAKKVKRLQTQRLTIQKQENEAREELKDLLKKHGFRKGKAYLFEDDSDGEPVKLDVLIDQKEPKAYVRKHQDPDADADEEGDGEESDQ